MAMLSGKGGGGNAQKRSDMSSVPSPAAVKRLRQLGTGSNKNPNTEFVTLEAYGEKDYVVPENYEHIRDNIYAVVKDGLIVEYKKIVLQSGQYVWLDCEAKEIMK